MQQALQPIDIRQILKVISATDEYALGNDFALGETNGSDSSFLQMLQFPVRFDGYILFFPRKGSFTVEINLNSCCVKEHSLLVSVPGNIIRINSPAPEQLELVFVLFSKEFVTGLNLDFVSVFYESVRMLHNPCIALTPEQHAMLRDYFQLAKKLLSSSQPNKRQIIGTLLASLSYLTADFWAEQLSVVRANPPGTASRTHRVFERFITLVTEHHTAERGMQFYADKLGLTPKYLSKIVKDVSGRSGPDWIDAFVILEAKNLLRYSPMTIKEVVYALNFPNPSVFHKFFKIHTGMTPTEYRKA